MGLVLGFHDDQTLRFQTAGQNDVLPEARLRRDFSGQI